MHHYAIKTITTGILLAVAIWVTYSMTRQTPEEVIEEANQAIIRTWKAQQSNCQNEATQTGTSTEVLQKLSICRDTPIPELKRISTDWNSGSIARVSKNDNSLESLKKKICNKQKNSPLCKQEWLVESLYAITEERIPWKNFFPILIGMTNAESSLGLDFAKDKVWWTCTGRNNWGGAKYMINDDNTRTYARKMNGFEYNYPRDQYDCNLFPFESVEEYWKSKVNGIRFGYKWCIDSKTPVACISGRYIGDPNVQERSWINNVSYFLN